MVLRLGGDMQVITGQNQIIRDPNESCMIDVHPIFHNDMRKKMEDVLASLQRLRQGRGTMEDVDLVKLVTR